MQPLAGKSLGVLNTSEDTIEVLRTWFEMQGMVVHAANLRDFRLGRANVREWLGRTKPDIVLYDVALPYEGSWAYFRKMRADTSLREVPVIVSTTNARVLQQLVGNTIDVCVHEVVGKPYDLEALTTLVVEALQQGRLTGSGDRVP